MNKNPFIEGSPIIYEGEVTKEFLIKGYKKQYNVEVESLLSPAERISIFRCKESGYRFYYPFEISGDSDFYKRLSEIDWYYMPWKWEHEICRNYIKENQRILEVGCGKGDFLKKISSQYGNIDCVGLELNENSLFSDNKIEIFNTTIEDFSIVNENSFDIVCSFQVLEHIALVNSFLKANIRCLRDNGLLVISVPNNESFIKYDKSAILNMPPHHMGLWTEESLRKIGEHFNLELLEVLFEPLQPYHFDYYVSLVLIKYFGKYLAKIILKFIKVFNLKKIIHRYLNRKSLSIKGHSVCIVFKKSIVPKT